MAAPHPLFAGILAGWRTAVLPLGPCRDCHELVALDPGHGGRCAWCHYRATHPEWVPPWREGSDGAA